jgi:hypothetical protein
MSRTIPAEVLTIDILGIFPPYQEAGIASGMPSPIGGVDDNVAQNLGLAGNAVFLGNFKAVAENLFGRGNWREIFCAGYNVDAALSANTIAVTGACHR